jgi:hypothetical protein
MKIIVGEFIAPNIEHHTVDIGFNAVILYPHRRYRVEGTGPDWFYVSDTEGRMIRLPNEENYNWGLVGN